MAVDLGSTMIDSCLIDAEDKDVLAQRSTKNPQRLYGSDVINRILTVKRDISFLVKMRDQAVSAIVELLQEMLEDTKKQVEHTEREHELVKLDAVAITGNTTMISILLGYDISDMGEAPFPTTLHGSVIVPGQELFTKEQHTDTGSLNRQNLVDRFSGKQTGPFLSHLIKQLNVHLMI